MGLWLYFEEKKDLEEMHKAPAMPQENRCAPIE